MIRLSFSGSRYQEECVSAIHIGKYYETQKIENYKGSKVCMCYSIDDRNVIKVEKQVKDLTLDECAKLNITPLYSGASKNYKIIQDFGYTFQIMTCDKYIDITDLVKESG